LSKEDEKMRKFYSEPELEIRKYIVSEDVCTNPSNPDDNKDLHDEDEYDYFGG
jgi:hypothetical protein